MTLKEKKGHTETRKHKNTDWVTTSLLELLIAAKKENYQISKLQSEKYDIICVYHSSDSIKSNQKMFLADLRNFICKQNQTLIFGDFNFNVICPNQNFILIELETWNFKQVLQNPTHVQEGVIDHCYMTNTFPIHSVLVSQKPVYYTDHDIIKVTIRHT